MSAIKTFYPEGTASRREITRANIYYCWQMGIIDFFKYLELWKETYNIPD